MIMRKEFICCLLLMALTGCEPFDLERKAFPICAKPSADIGYSADRLDVTLFLENTVGDIGVVGWDPGDGSGRNRVGPRVTYNYQQAGTYTVTVVIVNSCDDTYKTLRRITVTN